MRSWLELLWRLERNIFRIATSEEYRHLVRNLPNERTLDPASDGALVRWIVDEVADARPGVDIAAVQNLQSTLALVLLNRGLLRTGALERTVDALIDDILDELFGVQAAWRIRPARGRASLALATLAARHSEADACEHVRTVAEERGASGTEEQPGEGDRGYRVHDMVSFPWRVRGVRRPQNLCRKLGFFPA